MDKCAKDFFGGRHFCDCLFCESTGKLKRLEEQRRMEEAEKILRDLEAKYLSHPAESVCVDADAQKAVKKHNKRLAVDKRRVKWMAAREFEAAEKERRGLPQ